MQIKRTTESELKLNSFPLEARKKLKALRNLIIEKAKELESIEKIEESLKWGELSYKVKNGSPIRINWNSKSPKRYSIYFNCQSSL